MLTVLFGQSGLGKTSLLRAGLFPRLRREDMMPIAIRLDHDPAGAPAGRAGQVGDPRADRRAAGFEAPAPRRGETLWEYFHRTDLEIWTPRNRLATACCVSISSRRSIRWGGARKRPASAPAIPHRADRPGREPAARSGAPRVREPGGGRSALSLRRRRPCKVIISLREDYLPDLEGLAGPDALDRAQPHAARGDGREPGDSR